MDSIKHCIDVRVPAPSVPPSFNNGPVVPKNFDIAILATESEQRDDQQLEPDCLSPCDVMPL
jgi:hypothetical protein